MKLNRLQVASIILLVVMFAITIIFYQKLPETIATHWTNGNPNDFASRFWGAFSLPFIAIFLLILDVVISNLIASKGSFYDVFFFLLILALSVIQTLSILWNTGYLVNISGIGVVVVKTILGLMFISLGIFLVSTKQKVHLGVHFGFMTLTNNALDNQEVRMKTNRIAGIALIVVGMLVILLSPFPNLENVTSGIILWSSIALAIFTYAYSSYYFKHKDSGLKH